MSCSTPGLGARERPSRSEEDSEEHVFRISENRDSTFEHLARIPGFLYRYMCYQNSW